MRLILSFAFLLPAVAVAITTHDSIILPFGKVQGTQCKHSDAKSFLGIPFAKPPVGELRFMPPQLVTLTNVTFSNGGLDATKVGSPCIQWKKVFAWREPPPSEDCLYLNIYVAPNSSRDSALPVKVFAYGGGNNAGAPNFPLYDVCSLASDSIVVTFNYRLGPLGFLSLAKAGIGGNMAIQDYLAALRWVNQNIAYFGGDPAKVLLFGQSAGAADTFVVSTLPEVKGLIKGAAMESGGGQDLTPSDIAQQVGESYASALNCEANDLKCLQSRSVKELLAARRKTPALTKNGRSLGSEFGLNIPQRSNLNSAVLDGKIVKDEPLKVGSRVPIITGFNQYDSSLFVIPLFSNSGSITEKNYTDFLAQWGDNGPLIGKQYPLSKFQQQGNPTGSAVIDAVTHIATVAGFMCPISKILRATAAAGTPAFAYRFNHTPSCPWLWVKGKEFPHAKHLSVFKSAHTSELPFVFGGLWNEPWGNGSCNATENEQQISKGLVSAWTAMASNGNPSTKELQWPQFSVNNTRGLNIEQDTIVIGDIDFTECDFWDGIWAELGGVNFTSHALGSTNNSNSSAKESSAPATHKQWHRGSMTVMGAVIIGASTAVWS